MDLKFIKLKKSMSLRRLAIQFVMFVLIVNVGLFAAAVLEGIKPVVAGQSDLHNPDDLLVSYQELLNSSAEADGGVSIRIYRNGYAQIVYPKYMKQAGSYGVYLNDDALKQIWDLLISRNILALDEAHIRNEILRERKLQMESSSTLSSVSDTSEIRLEVYPNRYQSIGFGSGDRDAVKKITWVGLKWDVGLYPQIDMLQSLSKMQALLLSVMTQPDLKRLD